MIKNGILAVSGIGLTLFGQALPDGSLSSLSSITGLSLVAFLVLKTIPGIIERQAQAIEKQATVLAEVTERQAKVLAEATDKQAETQASAMDKLATAITDLRIHCAAVKGAKPEP